jgi:hypothetical protein
MEDGVSRDIHPARVLAIGIIGASVVLPAVAVAKDWSIATAGETKPFSERLSAALHANNDGVAIGPHGDDDPPFSDTFRDAFKDTFKDSNIPTG